jgi:hypothetical protein
LAAPAKTRPTRKRSELGLMQERAWRRDFEELRAKWAKELPPMPDPETHPAEFSAWMTANARTEFRPEEREIFDALKELPSIKFRKARDVEVWNWIVYLRACQMWGCPFDLKTCSLGANPANPNARPSKTLQYLGYLVASAYPDVFVGSEDERRRQFVRLYDAIRNWRRSVSTISTA